MPAWIHLTWLETPRPEVILIWDPFSRCLDMVKEVRGTTGASMVRGADPAGTAAETGAVRLGTAETEALES